MKRKGQINIGAIMILFVGIIFALAIIPAIFENQSTLTDKTTITAEVEDISSAWVTVDADINESISFSVTNAYASDDWQVTSCAMTGVAITNSTGTSAFVEDTDFEFDQTLGTWNLLNTTKTVNGLADNDTKVTYIYCQDGYVGASGTRTIAGLIGLMTALGLLGYVIYYAIGKSGWMK